MSYGQLAEFFSKIREGQAPTLFTQQLLKDLGFSSSNHRAFIPILKELGFLSPDGAPTSRYHEYRDYSRSNIVMGSALKEAYSDLFLIKQNPTSADKSVIQGKFKSFHNVSDNVAKNMTNTFYALLALADLKQEEIKKSTQAPILDDIKKDDDAEIKKEKPIYPIENNKKTPGLYYNIQIHLPATKDIEVYNSIFKSLKEHLFET
jgi:hypothetical protein